MKSVLLKKVKVDEAAARAAEWAKLTTAQKIRSLDDRLGKGEGAVKQRAKLAALLAKEGG